MDFWREFAGPNAAAVLELYARFRQNPQAVDEASRRFFRDWTPPEATTPAGRAGASVMGAVNLALAIRSFGHLAARLDPLGSPPPGDPELAPEAHGITEADLRRLPANLIDGPAAEGARNALEALEAVRAVYTGTTGYGYGHIHVPAERAWLRQAAESGRFRPPRDPIDPQHLLERLTQIECLERFLHKSFPGRTRFSLEGLDMLVPILDELIGGGAEAGVRHVLIGMAHRGRLNVLAHVLGKPVAQILAEFKDPAARNFTIREDLSWTGDVTYHLGARRAIRDGPGVIVTITLPPNPSHLELINPIVEGMARAAAEAAQQPGAPVIDPGVALPILIHGDAAFPGQGIVAETLNLSRLAGYRAGGTIHVIANNQLGYTTDPGAERSTLYASDLAKGFEIPIIHVNADDPEACLEAARLAGAYRARFQKDFLIDLVGYRRFGHNEGDEPAFTQPRMYQAIAAHPSVRTLWAQALVDRGLIPPDRPATLVDQQLRALQQALESLHAEQELAAASPVSPPRGLARHVQTAVPADRLQRLRAALAARPADFTPHPKLLRVLERRYRPLALDEHALDWGATEELALASIVEDGVPIRLTGEDVERGTFGHRHAVLHDEKTGHRFVPLQHLPQARAAYAVYNSPLTENAAVGFEYGYNIQSRTRLVIWEAQYGDFLNMAQPVLDEFLLSARAKWGQTPSLVLLLPHGFEGQGPDHSSARPERLLQLAAEINLRLANCTTAGQYFHLLRRQAALLASDPLPLLILTPKSLLRQRDTFTSLRELSEGHWQPVLDDPKQPDATRLLLCSGKVYFDLLASPKRDGAVAIARIEQLYPFPEEEVASLLARYPRLEEAVWVQEEPENMGAWSTVSGLLSGLLGGCARLRLVARPPNSSPAEGSTAWHTKVQRALTARAFGVVDV